MGVYIGKVMKIKEDKINNLTVVTKYKEVSEGYFEKNKYCNYENSYYTFDDSRMVVSERDVEKGDVRSKFGDEMLFVTITAKISNDYGREFMEKNNLFKIKNKNSIEMYNDN